MLPFHSHSPFMYVLGCPKYLRHDLLFGCLLPFFSSALFVNRQSETTADARTFSFLLLARCCDRAGMKGVGGTDCGREP